MDNIAENMSVGISLVAGGRTVNIVSNSCHIHFSFPKVWLLLKA